MKIVKSLCIKKIFTIMVLLCMFGLVPSSVTAQKDPIILNPTNPPVTQPTPGEGETYELLAPLPIFGKDRKSVV